MPHQVRENSYPVAKDFLCELVGGGFDIGNLDDMCAMRSIYRLLVVTPIETCWASSSHDMGERVE